LTCKRPDQSAHVFEEAGEVGELGLDVVTGGVVDPAMLRGGQFFEAEVFAELLGMMLQTPNKSALGR